MAPKTFADKKLFKSSILQPMNKFNAMNFDECNNAIMDLW
jgi:hypothetical protein